MLCEKKLSFAARWTRIQISLLPHDLLRDLEQFNSVIEVQFPHVKMEIILSTWAVVRNKQGQVFAWHMILNR